MPQSGEMIVKIGTEVTPGQIVARTPMQTVFVIVDAGQILGVPPEKVNELVIVEKNSAVDEGTVLAQKKGLRARQVIPCGR